MNDTRVNRGLKLNDRLFSPSVVPFFFLLFIEHLSSFSRLRERWERRKRENREKKKERKKQGSVQKEDRDVQQMQWLVIRRRLFFSSAFLSLLSLCYLDETRESLNASWFVSILKKETKIEQVLLSSPSIKKNLLYSFSFWFRWTTNDDHRSELNLIETCDYLCLSFGYALWSLMDKLTR